MDNNCANKKEFKNDLSRKNTPELFQIVLKKDLKEIQPLNIGKATLPPGIQQRASTPPNCVHLFYTCQGSGSFKLGDTLYHVKEGDFCIMPPGTIVPIYADAKTGWMHRWICFTGAIILDFMSFPVVFTLPEEFIATLCDPAEEDRNLSARVVADLYNIYARIHTATKNTQDHVQNVIDRVNASYMESLSVTKMAAEMNINRTHLSRLFKTRMGITIQEYILHLRINKAKQCLADGHSCSDTALLCGFNNQANFSRTFLKETGVRPTAWLNYIKKDTYNKPR